MRTTTRFANSPGRIAFACLFLVCLTGLRGETPAPVDLFVSPSGDDSAAGTARDSAFRTIARARDEVRRRKADQGANGFTVRLMPGTYPQEASLTFGPEDSGREGAPVTYRAEEPGTAILTGAAAFKLSDFAPVPDPAVLARLAPEARDHVVALSLAAHGIGHSGPFPEVFSDRGGIFELFDTKGRLPLSRWPNEGFAKMGPVLRIGDKTTPGSFEYVDERPARWTENKSVWLKGQWRVGWEDPAIRVETIDPQAHTITFAAGIPNGIGSKYHRPTDGSRIGSGEEPWAAINLLEEIDRPGEWAVDFDTQTLYLWPRDPDSEIIITQMASPLIEVTGASDLKFEGLKLEHSLGDGIVLENVDRCLVAGCTIANIAGRGVVLNGRYSGVQSCDIHDIGEGAIYVSGGDRKSLARSENFVLNNHLSHYGLLKNQYSAGVHVGTMGNPAGGNMLRDAVGIRVANNVIHHAPRDAFLYSGNDNLFEYNEIYYCAYNTRDTGAWYSWLDWTMRGNVIRYNYVHDTVGGINPDDGASGNVAYGNVFVGNRTGVWIASGPDNKIRHNIFVKDSGAVFGIDDRGVGRGYATNQRLISRVEELNPSQEPWKSAHPELATMLENRPELPWRTEFVGNLIVSKNPSPTLNKMTRQSQALDGLLTQKDNLTVSEDPGFVDMAGHNYALKPDAEVFQKIPGFEPIPFDKIGLQLDQFRTRLPDETERQRRPEDSPYPPGTDHNFGT